MYAMSFSDIGYCWDFFGEDSNTASNLVLGHVYCIEGYEGGLSAIMLYRDLKIAYGTVWHMIRNIRWLWVNEMNCINFKEKSKCMKSMSGSGTDGKRGRDTKRAEVIVSGSLNAKTNA